LENFESEFKLNTEIAETLEVSENGCKVEMKVIQRNLTIKIPQYRIFSHLLNA
jgi:hypothetical protein